MMKVRTPCSLRADPKAVQSGGGMQVLATVTVAAFDETHPWTAASRTVAFLSEIFRFQSVAVVKHDYWYKAFIFISLHSIPFSLRRMLSIRRCSGGEVAHSATVHTSNDALMFFLGTDFKQKHTTFCPPHTCKERSTPTSSHFSTCTLLSMLPVSSTPRSWVWC